MAIMESRRCLNQGILERISIILTESPNELKGSEISYFLLQCRINDVTPNITKWKRLFSAFASVQNTDRCSNKILKFVQTVLNPARFTDNQTYEIKRRAINESLSYVGYELQPNGRFREVPPATTISEAQRRANDLLANLQIRNAHQEIFKYCKAELVDNNYFHAVFEACKGLFARIRQMSLINADGTPLAQYVFNHPILVINSYKTKQETDEQKGFEAILEGLCYMFRNPEAHQPKIEWPVSEQDALEILSLISYCHRRLDKAHRIE
jgi:uncharacterized protein (TIGR02391 family)